MFERMKFEIKGIENVKDDDELEMLLGEIPHATSSMNLHPTLSDAHHQLSSLADRGYCHLHPTLNDAHHQLSSLADRGYCHAFSAVKNSNTHGHGHGVYSDELLKHKYAYTSSSVSSFSLPSDGSSSSLFSGGALSMSDIGSPSRTQCEEFKSHLISGNGFWVDVKDKQSNLFDDFNLSRNFSKMYISNEEEGMQYYPNRVQYCGQFLNGDVRMSFEDRGASGNSARGFPDNGEFNHSVPGRPMNLEGEMLQDQRIADLCRPRYSPSKSDCWFSRPDFGNPELSPQSCRRTNVSSHCRWQMELSDVSSSLARASTGDSFSTAQSNWLKLIEARDAFYAANAVQFCRPMLHSHENLDAYHSVLPNGRNHVPLHGRVPQGTLVPFTRDDSLIIHEGIGYGMKGGDARSRTHKTKGFHHEIGSRKTKEKRLEINGQCNASPVRDGLRNARMFSPTSLPAKCSSLAEAQGYIYHMAKDQYGCRFLQRIFDEGTAQDVQIIFNEIVNHAIELMMNPFGNYLMQKLLEVCNEEHRMVILLRVTADPGELVRISLNTHGTRVVQKLIETLKIRQQISLVISALEPGFLALIKDLNGNHVVQRCLQCFTPEDSRFIYVAAAKYCMDIATHQHGCCVLQRCISHSTGELRENLVSEISRNGLQLAQDAFGNYVVQFILELKIPSATSKLTSQFKGNYMQLSTQKFSSHVVEKCLIVCNGETRAEIIHELLSAPCFELLLQDPHANYVIQTALRVSEGPLLTYLVKEIDSFKPTSRNSPYSKRIFCHKLLKR